MAKQKKESLKKLPIGEHLRELRARALSCLCFFALAFVLCLSFCDVVYDLVAYPMFVALKDARLPEVMIFTKLPEAFGAQMSASLALAFVASLPWFAMQAWLFLVPALYKDERKSVLPYIVLTPILFVAGVLFCYFFVLPPTIGFFATFVNPNDVSVPLTLSARVGDYMEFSLSMLKAFGLAFLFPLVLVWLVGRGIVSRDALKRGRKYAALIIFIIAAALTPPDVASQIMLAVPLLILYEISILITWRKE